MQVKRFAARGAVGIFATVGAFGVLTMPAIASNGNGNGGASSHATQGNSGTSGDVNSPQPRSNADNNGNGANVTGPYDSTRDGSPSGNGNGDGQATGEPCAGCVGKADNKNPSGQMPGPSDNNNGYECDGNHGIAQTNPAHTGCETPPPECTPTDENPCTPPECTPSDQHPCVPPGTPETPGTPPAGVLGETLTATPASGQAEAAAATSTGEELAQTGSSVVTLVPFALVAIALGAASVMASRRWMAGHPS